MNFVNPMASDSFRRLTAGVSAEKVFPSGPSLDYNSRTPKL